MTFKLMPRNAQTWRENCWYQHTVDAERKVEPMKLEDLLGEELYSQVKAKIDAQNEGREDKQKHIRFADLSEGGYISRGKYESLQADMDGNIEELKKANALIEEMKAAAGKDSELQGKISDYEAEIENLKNENATLKLENALKMALKDAGADDVEYLMFKAKEKGEMKLDEDGKISGLADLIKELQTLHPTHFVGSADGADGLVIIEPNKLPQGDGEKTVTKEKFLKMGYSERLQFKKDSPELFDKYTKG